MIPERIDSITLKDQMVEFMERVNQVSTLFNCQEPIFHNKRFSLTLFFGLHDPEALQRYHTTFMIYEIGGI